LFSAPAQSIAWKDLSPKWPIMCQVGHQTLLTRPFLPCFSLCFLETDVRRLSESWLSVLYLFG